MTSSSAPHRSETWVWIHLPGRLEPTLCGVVRHDGVAGTFVYGRSYLERADALPIDPIAVPLEAKAYTTPHLGGWFSSLLDAGPDAWGKGIIDRALGVQDQRGYLLNAHGQAAGALSFSARPDQPPASTMAEVPRTLPVTLALQKRLEAGNAIDRVEMLRLMDGAGSGGARPKLTLLKDGSLWLAKGESVKDKADLAPVPIAEAALLSLATEVGIHAPRHEVEMVDGRPVLLVERFDRAPVGGLGGVGGGFSRWRYVSAQTIFWSAPAVAQWSFSGSYVNLARRLSVWLRSPTPATQELYRRLVFNALVGNCDDHEKNHGLIAGADGEFALSPVFDLTVTATAGERQMLAMPFGSDGALITLPNLLSECEVFGYGKPEAEDIIRAQWQLLQERSFATLLRYGCDEERASRTVALMPGWRVMSDMDGMRPQVAPRPVA